MEESLYRTRVRYYNVDAQAERLHRENVQRLLRDNTDSYQTMLYSVQNRLATRDATNTTDVDRIKEIATRIRLFD